MVNFAFFGSGNKFGPFEILAIEPPDRVGLKLRVLIRTGPNTRLRRWHMKVWDPLHHRMTEKMLAVYKREVESFSM